MKKAVANVTTVVKADAAVKIERRTLYLNGVDGDGTYVTSASDGLVIEKRPTARRILLAFGMPVLATAVLFHALTAPAFSRASPTLRTFTLPAIVIVSCLLAAAFLSRTTRFVIRPGSSEGVRVVGRMSEATETTPTESEFHPEVRVGNRWVAMGRSASMDIALEFAALVAEAGGIPMLGLRDDP